MNKIITSLVVFLTLFTATAQGKVNDTIVQKNKQPYNTWSIEANFGTNKAIRPFNKDFAVSGDEKFLSVVPINHFDIGVRKMLNTKFGFKFDFASDFIESKKSSSELKTFKSVQNRIALQGIINLTRVLNFNVFSNRLGLIAHGGVQVSKLTGKTIGSKRDNMENNGGYMFGLSPQFKITNKLIFTSDFSVLVNNRQHIAWDGNPSEISNNLSGEMNVLSIGLSLYLGNKKEHSDWIVKNYGVNQKSIAVNQGKTAINPEKTVVNPERIITVIENGIDKIGEFIVSFDLNENEPNISNSDNFKKILNLLTVNNDIKAIIFFFEEGDTENLSIARTNSIKNILVSNNINPERITISKKSVGPVDKKDVKLVKDIKILLYRVK